MVEAADAAFPSLFSHRKREDWGVSVLSGQSDGKRRYLFEDGEERVMAAAAHDLIVRVDRPNREQQATYARLTALLAKRAGADAAPSLVGSKALLDLLEKFRLAYPEGLCSAGWQASEHHQRARRARQIAAGKAPRALSRAALQGLAPEQLGDVWNQTVALIASSELCAEQLQATSNTDERRALGEAVRDLICSSDPYERRLDRFLLRYGAVFRQDLGWQGATALAALVAPFDHVCVEPNAFRKQLKVLARYSGLGPRPGGAGYIRCRAMARMLASALAAHGEVPTDLFEVHALIRAMS
jgi:hypothetical protein